MLDKIDSIVESESPRDAARVLSLLVQRRMPAQVREEMNAYIRGHGFVVKSDENPRVQIPGVHDRAVIAAEFYRPKDLVENARLDALRQRYI